jgi:hypothetical protein
VADAEDQLVRSSSELTRGDLLKRGTAAAFSISMFGGLTDRALGFYGPLKYAHKQLAGELRIMQWAHFVPAYDQWLDNTYVKRWGEANDVEVKVDHINNALLYSTGASQVAAQSGHDLFWFISPPSTFQKQVVPVTDIVQEVSRKLGPMSRVARKSTYNPKTKQFYGFPDDYAPDPVQYRRSYLQEAGVSLNSWESLRQGAPKLKAIGHPVGLGMSNEIDSNMLLTSLLYCYGGFIQNEENRIVIGQGAPRRGAIEALTVMRDIYRRGMSDEVLQRARHGRLRDLEVREEQGSGEEVPDRPAARLPRALRPQRVLQLPRLDGRDQGRVQGNPQDVRTGHAQAARQVHRPHDDRREVHDEPGPSGQHDTGHRRDLQHVPHPADVRRGRAGEVDPFRGSLGLRAQGAGHLPEVEEPGARVTPDGDLGGSPEGGPPGIAMSE